MSSRFLIPALCVGAIVLACGPRARNEASAPKKSDSVVALATISASPSAPAIHQKGVQRAQKKPTIAAELYVRAADSSIRLALHLTNTSKKRIELTFPSGQTYDFVVLDSLGREMWRW